MQKRHSFILVLVISMTALALSACGADKAPPNVAPATALPAPMQAAPAAATPAAAAATVSPLPTPAADSPLPTPGAESSGVTGETTAQSGAITGKILVQRAGADMPVGNMLIGLAEIIRDEQGQPRASGYAPDTAFKAVTTDDGGFAINNVPAGTYSLILDAVITSYQLENPVTRETILVDVKPGKVSDVGVLLYSTLPVPGFSN